MLEVSASVLTGNVLVRFQRECDPESIATAIHRVVISHGSSRDAPAVTSAPESSADRKTPDRRENHLAHKRRKKHEDLALAARQPIKPWHRMPADEVLRLFDSSAVEGLSPEVAEKNLKKYGPNVVPAPAARSGLAIFIDQFNSLPIGLLSAGAVLSVVTGGLLDAVGIMAAVGINAVIGYFTESDAERTINSLKTMVRPIATVRRAGMVMDIPAEDVIVGDILILTPGTYVAADARLIECAHLSADESVLTGESLPVIKNTAVVKGENVPVGDRFNMVYGGTLITGGQGTAVVAATARFTELGEIQSLVAESTSPDTPVERQLDRVGNQLVIISSAVCGVVFVMGLLQGRGVIEMLKTAISLAVAAVPEGLPTVATTTLSLGIKNMRRRKVLFRNLEAVCTMGSVQTICLDKTGTITLNRMSVVKISTGMRDFDVNDGRYFHDRAEINHFENDELLRLIQACSLCSESEIVGDNGNFVLNGSPTENALVQLALASGIDVKALRRGHPLLDVNHRSENRLYMSTLHETGNAGKLLALKGSPIEVLGKCSRHVRDGEIADLSEDDREWIETHNEMMAADALRVLGVAVAYRNGDRAEDDDNGLIWLGLVGMADPIREGVPECIASFHRAGLETVMITGDQSATAYAVGKELDLNQGQEPLKILDSTALDGADPSLLKALSADVHVFSRVSPSHKLKIVQALQSSDQVVAMTGDGINDGPALKVADVGIAMGSTGTDVAREIADVVLEEDNLETLIVALSDGRTIFNNIRKSLHYLLATNFSEIFVVLVSGAFGLGYPLNAMQLLWINLISDVFPGLALALEPPEPDVLSQPPRDPKEPIVRREDYARISFEGVTMSLTSLAAYAYGLRKHGQGPASATFVFHSLTTSQILHALTCRSQTISIFDREKLPPNPYLSVAVFGSLGLQVMTLFFPPIRRLLNTTPVSAGDLVVIGGTAIVPLLITEMTKTPEPVEDVPSETDAEPEDDTI